MGTTNTLDLNNRVDKLAKSYPASKVMMSDGITSVEDALDEVKSGLITVRTAQLTFTNAGYNLYTNNGVYTKSHHTLLSSNEAYVVMGGTESYVRLVEYSNITGELVPCSDSTVTINCVIIEWD